MKPAELAVPDQLSILGTPCENINGDVKSFNGRIGDELLNKTRLRSMTDV